MNPFPVWLALSFLAQPLTLGEAVKRALEAYPAVRAAREDAAAARAGVSLARTAYMPRLDFSAQANRATRNNIFGAVLPPSVVAPISGPVLSNASLDSVWGSSTGLAASWEPFDFGLRRAQVDAAEAARRRSEAAADRTRLEIAAAAADAFLTVLAAEQAEAASRAGVERARVVLEVVGSLVRSGLRPGADLSRSQAELAAAETQLIRARQNVDAARAALAGLLNAEVTEIAPGDLLKTLPPSEPPASAAVHPGVQEHAAAREEAAARTRAAERSYFPRFYLQGSAYARGTGALPDGRTLGGANGLAPNIYNWGLGFSVTFPLFDYPAVHARSAVEAARERSETARYDQTVLDLRTAVAKAEAVLNGARAVAGKTPVQVQAARAAEQQAAARYRAGLGTIAEVADTQRLVTQAEIDDALARLGVWRAALGVAVARGDISSFLK